MQEWQEASRQWLRVMSLAGRAVNVALVTLVCYNHTATNMSAVEHLVARMNSLHSIDEGEIAEYAELDSYANTSVIGSNC